MPQVIITDLPLDADGHQFWVSSVDYFGNVNISGMPTINMAFPTLVAPSISNVTNIYSTYTEVDTLETTEAQEIYPVFDRVNAVQITPIVVTGITTTAQYFSYFEIQIDTSAAFNISPSILVPTSTFSDPTHTSRPITFSCIDGTEYHFRVRIFDVLGNVSPWSSSTTETAGDTTAPNEVGSSNVDFTSDGHFFSATIDFGTYTQASDHAYYEWWVNTSSSFPGGNGLREDDETFYFANKSGQTVYLWCAAVDRSGNRSANYTTSVGNVAYVSADFWTETGNVTDTSGDPIVDVTDRGIEDQNGVTIIDFTTGSGVTNYNAELSGAINFGTGGALHLTDNAVSFAGTPIVGMEIIGRGLKLYQDANNYIVMEKDGVSSVNFEVVGGTIKTSGGTSYVQMDSTGVKGYNASTQRFQLSSDGSGWLGGSSDFYWDTSGNVTIAGTVTVTNIAATTGTIGGWDITSSEINITPVSNVTARLNSSGYIAFGDPAPTTYSNNAGAWLGMDSGTAKMSIYTDSSNFLQWDGSTLTMTGADFDDGTITASVFQTAASGARVVINTADGVRAFNSTPTQTVSIDTDGSGWFGLTGTRAVEWTTAGVVTIAGWTATDTEFSGSGIITGGTLRTGTGNARVEMTSADGLRAFNSSGVQTADIDTDGSGWFGLTGTRAIEWTSAGAATIAGWSATASLFRSATSGARVQLDASSNRVSIFDAVNEKVAMGYLNGLPKNPVYGWCFSSTATTLTDDVAGYTVNELSGGTIEILEGTGNGQTRTVSSNTATVITISASWTTNPDTTSKYKVSNYGNWTASDYGFWAREGDHLAIDGDVRYDNGDWIIQHDASYLVQDSSDNTIIRLGTDAGEKGLFTYNTSGTNLSKFVTDEIYIGDATDYLKYTVSGGLEVVGNITVTSYPSQPFDEDALLLWPLDSFPVDQSGNDNDANSTYGANVTYTDNGVAGGYCTHFPNGTGTGDYLRPGSTYSLQEMTITFWAKSSDTGQNLLLNHGATNIGGFHFNGNTNRPLLSLGSSNYRYWNDESEQDDGEWHFWCVEITGSAQSDINNSKLFVDTDECTVFSTLAIGAPTALSYLRLGYGYNGDLQDFRIYSRILTSSERTALYTNPGNKGVTRISGDKITTGTIESTNWGSALGSQFDLNDGTFYLGGSSSPKLSWNGANLSVSGSITITGGSGLDNLSDSGDLADMAATPGSAGLYLDSTAMGYWNGSSWNTYISNAGTLYIGGSATNAYTTGQDEQKLSELLNDTPGSAGFYMDGTHLGFYDGAAWDVWLGSSGSTGLFYLGGSSGDLQWDGSDLVLGGSAKLAFGTAFSPGGNLLVGAEDWKETQTPVTYFTSGYFNACFGDDDNNHIINSHDPYNNKSLIWECDPDDGTGSHGGWSGYDFDISRNQRFRFMNWVKRVGTDDGNLYFGCQSGAQDTSNLTASGSDSNNSNPYFGFPDLGTIKAERINNGNCEGTGNWTAQGTPTTNARSATQHHGGSYSWRITVNAELEGTRSDLFTTTAQMEMCASFWVYGDGEDWMAYISDGTQRWHAHESNTTTIITPSTGSWSQYKIYFATSLNETSGVGLYFLSAPGTDSGTLYFDDVVCTECLVCNGNQEIVSDFWVIHNTPTFHGLSTTQKRNGTYSRRITVNAVNEGTKHTNISLKAGRQYRVTTWLYGNASATWQIYLDEAVNHYALNSTGGSALTPSAAWNRYDIDFVATEDTDSAILYILSVGTSGTLYIDDVTMQETPWLLYVGFIHPEAYKGTASVGGIYHYKTGQKIDNLTDYKHMSTADDQEHRVFFYQCTTDYEINRLYMFSPKIHIVDGSEPSISDVIGNAQFISSDIQNTTNISSFLVNSPTIRGGDFANGNYVQMDEDGIGAFNSGAQTVKIDSSDGSGYLASENFSWDASGNVTLAGSFTSTATITGGTIQTSSGTGQRVVLSGSANTQTFYNSSNQAIITLKGSAGGTSDTGIEVNENGIIAAQKDSNNYFRMYYNNLRFYNNEAISGTDACIFGHNKYNSGTLYGIWGSAGYLGSSATKSIGIGAYGQGGTTSVGLYASAIDGTTNIGAEIVGSTYDISVGDIAGNYTTLKTDSNGYLNITPTGDKLILWESGGSANDSTQMWTDTSGIFNLKPDGDKLILWESGGAANDSTQMWTDTGGYFNIKPDGDRVRIWDSAGASGDYGDIYSDAAGNLILQAGNGIVNVDDTFNITGSYRMDGSDIINTSKQQTGDFKTRSYVIFGRSGTISTDTYIGGPGNLNDASYRGEYVIPYDSVLTAVALSVQTAFTFTSSGDQVVVHVQRATYPSGSFASGLNFNISLVASYDAGDHGDYSKMVTGQTSVLTAGDRIRVWLNITSVTSVQIINPNITICLLSE